MKQLKSATKCVAGVIMNGLSLILHITIVLCTDRVQFLIF